MKRVFEFEDDKKNKRKNIDFNEYGLNKYNDYKYDMKYIARTGPNCVKRKTK